MRPKGTCKTCKRKDVTLVAADECSVCHRVAGVANKVLVGQPITSSDQATMRRVLAATAGGATTSIEARVAQKKGWVELFARGRGTVAGPRKAVEGLTAATPGTTWPQQVTTWQCSDGSHHTDETLALRHELSLVGQRRAA